MKHVICPVCSGNCVRNGKTKSGSQRWLCKTCSVTFTQQIDNSSKQLKIFLNWLLSKETQREMPGGGRTFPSKNIKVLGDLAYASADGIKTGCTLC